MDQNLQDLQKVDDIIPPQPKVKKLEGDTISQVPKYLKFLLSHGPEFVPHDEPKYTMCHMRQVKHEFDEFERVLIWSAHFCRHQPDCDEYAAFPHRKLHKPTGSVPDGDIIEGLGQDAITIQSACSCGKDSLLLACDDIAGSVRRGVAWHHHHFRSFLHSHVVAGTDKDASFVLMSVNAYLNELDGNFASVHRSGRNVYDCLGSHFVDTSDVGKHKP